MKSNNNQTSSLTKGKRNPNQPSKANNSTPTKENRSKSKSAGGGSTEVQSPNKGKGKPSIEIPNSVASKARRSGKGSKPNKGAQPNTNSQPKQRHGDQQKPKTDAPKKRAGAYAIDKVKDEDTYQYDLCIKCWCAVVEDTCGVVQSRELRHAISTFGLYACIASADSFAKATLTAIDAVDEAPEHYQLNALWGAIVATCIDGRYARLESGDLSMLFGGDSFIATAACCQLILRFPKRFTIVEPDIASAVSKFKQVHQDTIRYGREWSRWPGHVIMEHLRNNLREILIPKDDEVYKMIVWRYERSVGSFSSGAIYLNQDNDAWNPRIGDAQWRCRRCKEGVAPKQCKKCDPAKPRKWEVFSDVTSRDPAVKWGALGLDSDYLYEFSARFGYYPPVALPRTKYIHYAMSVPGHMPLDYPCYRKRDVLISAVPKDYETSRMIAPETAFLNVEGGRVRDLLIALVTSTGAISYMPPEDQSLNRDRARQGSYFPQDNPYVTGDLSHASDSIAREFFFSLCPVELKTTIRNALSDYMVVDGKLRKVGMLATSGSRLTPILQSCFFLAILWTACDLAGEPRDVSVYNDDIICRQSVADTVVELLELCGCTLNRKKSFFYGPFRESCGGEYLNGFDVTGVYWPRKAIRKPGSKTARRTLEWMQTIVSMQHKLYSFPTARQVLEEEVLRVIPDMTYSPVAAECDDLWAKWLDDEKSMRLGHYCIASKHVPRERYTDPRIQLYAEYGQQLGEFYAYTEWLRRGPRYEDAFCRGAGISTYTEAHVDKLIEQQLIKQKPIIRATW